MVHLIITEMHCNGQINVGVTKLEISTIYPTYNHMLFGKEIHSPSWILHINPSATYVIYIYIYIYIYGAPILDVSRSQPTTQHGR